jgi:hypothetical protein
MMKKAHLVNDWCYWPLLWMKEADPFCERKICFFCDVICSKTAWTLTSCDTYLLDVKNVCVSSVKENQIRALIDGGSTKNHVYGCYGHLMY